MRPPGGTKWTPCGCMSTASAAVDLKMDSAVGKNAPEVRTREAREPRGAQKEGELRRIK